MHTALLPAQLEVRHEAALKPTKTRIGFGVEKQRVFANSGYLQTGAYGLPSFLLQLKVSGVPHC